MMKSNVGSSRLFSLLSFAALMSLSKATAESLVESNPEMTRDTLSHPQPSELLPMYYGSNQIETFIPNFTIDNIAIPASWSCEMALFNNSNGCHCGCGAPDPDCLDPSQLVIGCFGGECIEGSCQNELNVTATVIGTAVGFTVCGMICCACFVCCIKEFGNHNPRIPIQMSNSLFFPGANQAQPAALYNATPLQSFQGSKMPVPRYHPTDPGRQSTLTTLNDRPCITSIVSSMNPSLTSFTFDPQKQNCQSVKELSIEF